MYKTLDEITQQIEESEAFLSNLDDLLDEQNEIRHSAAFMKIDAIFDDHPRLREEIHALTLQQFEEEELEGSSAAPAPKRAKKLRFNFA